MSILIKGMEMPNTCKACVCSNCYERMDMILCDITNKQLDEKQWKSERHPDCPLIEVTTPHGELVDRNGLMDIYADRLTAVAERYSPDSSECGILSGAMKLLAIMPTIIEAED